MRTKAVLLGMRDLTMGALMVLIVAGVIQYFFYPCVIKTAEIQAEASHVEGK